MRILLGLFIIAVGIFLIMKTEWMLRNFGRIGFFERYLGSDGGTRLGYKLIGLIFIVIGYSVVTNTIGSVVMWVFSPLIPNN